MLRCQARDQIKPADRTIRETLEGDHKGNCHERIKTKNWVKSLSTKDEANKFERKLFDPQNSVGSMQGTNYRRLGQAIV